MKLNSLFSIPKQTGTFIPNFQAAYYDEKERANNKHLYNHPSKTTSVQNNFFNKQDNQTNLGLISSNPFLLESKNFENKRIFVNITIPENYDFDILKTNVDSLIESLKTFTLKFNMNIDNVLIIFSFLKNSLDQVSFDKFFQFQNNNFYNELRERYPLIMPSYFSLTEYKHESSSLITLGINHDSNNDKKDIHMEDININNEINDRINDKDLRNDNNQDINDNTHNKDFSKNNLNRESNINNNYNHNIDKSGIDCIILHKHNLSLYSSQQLLFLSLLPCFKEVDDNIFLVVNIDYSTHITENSLTQLLLSLMLPSIKDYSKNFTKENLVNNNKEEFDPNELLAKYKMLFNNNNRIASTGLYSVSQNSHNPNNTFFSGILDFDTYQKQVYEQHMFNLFNSGSELNHKFFMMKMTFSDLYLTEKYFLSSLGNNSLEESNYMIKLPQLSQKTLSIGNNANSNRNSTANLNSNIKHNKSLPHSSSLIGNKLLDFDNNIYLHDLKFSSYLLNERNEMNQDYYNINFIPDASYFTYHSKNYSHVDWINQNSLNNAAYLYKGIEGISNIKYLRNHYTNLFGLYNFLKSLILLILPGLTTLVIFVILSVGFEEFNPAYGFTALYPLFYFVIFLLSLIGDYKYISGILFVLNILLLVYYFFLIIVAIIALDNLFTKYETILSFKKSAFIGLLIYNTIIAIIPYFFYYSKITVASVLNALKFILFFPTYTAINVATSLNHIFNVKNNLMKVNVIIIFLLANFWISLFIYTLHDKSNVQYLLALAIIGTILFTLKILFVLFDILKFTFAYKKALSNNDYYTLVKEYFGYTCFNNSDLINQINNNYNNIDYDSHKPLNHLRNKLNKNNILEYNKKESIKNKIHKLNDLDDDNIINHTDEDELNAPPNVKSEIKGRFNTKERNEIIKDDEGVVYGDENEEDNMPIKVNKKTSSVKKIKSKRVNEENNEYDYEGYNNNEHIHKDANDNVDNLNQVSPNYKNTNKNEYDYNEEEYNKKFGNIVLGRNDEMDYNENEVNNDDVTEEYIDNNKNNNNKEIKENNPYEYEYEYNKEKENDHIEDNNNNNNNFTNDNEYNYEDGNNQISKIQPNNDNNESHEEINESLTANIHNIKETNNNENPNNIVNNTNNTYKENDSISNHQDMNNHIDINEPNNKNIEDNEINISQQNVQEGANQNIDHSVHEQIEVNNSNNDHVKNIKNDDRIELDDFDI